MMFRSLFDRDLFAEFDRLQRDLQQAFDSSPSIRGLGRGGYPALNIGSTPQSVEIYVFAPGIDPGSVDVQLDRGVLTLSGERARALPRNGSGNGAAAEGRPAADEKTAEKTAEKATVHLEERFAGRFRRVVSLPEDIDPAGVQARYRDGVLHVSVPRRAAPQPRRIEVQ